MNIYPLSTFHSGGENCLPNSMEFLEKAALLGPDITEIDIRVSRDGIALLHHDNCIEKKGHPYCLNDYDYEELKKRDSSLVSLSEALDFASGHNLFLNLDMKHLDVADAMLFELEKHGMAGDVLISGCHEEQASYLRARNSGLRIILCFEDTEELSDDGYQYRMEGIVKAASRLGCCGLNVNYRECRPCLLTYTALRGLPVYVWTIDDQNDMKTFLKSSVFSITTNELEMMNRARSEL